MTNPTAPNMSGTPAGNAPATGTGATSTEDDLLNSIRQNFGGNNEHTVAKAKRDSLAEMNKKLPDWNLEPPEVFLS